MCDHYLPPLIGLICMCDHHLPPCVYMCDHYLPPLVGHVCMCDHHLPSGVHVWSLFATIGRPHMYVWSSFATMCIHVWSLFATIGKPCVYVWTSFVTMCTCVITICHHVYMCDHHLPPLVGPVYNYVKTWCKEERILWSAVELHYWNNAGWLKKRKEKRHCWFICWGTASINYKNGIMSIPCLCVCVCV